MPRRTAEDHRSWAKRNEEFYEHIGGSESAWSGWPMTVLFYVVVHEVTAFLVDQRIQTSTHADTRAALRQNPAWTQLAAMYDQFFGYSRDARYRCRVHSKLELKLAESLLDQVRNEIERLKGLP
jgi:hypothetical protein